MTSYELCVCQTVEMLCLADSFPESLRNWLIESLQNTPEVDADHELLEKVLCRAPDSLCRQQKEREECHCNESITKIHKGKDHE